MGLSRGITYGLRFQLQNAAQKDTRHRERLKNIQNMSKGWFCNVHMKYKACHQPLYFARKGSQLASVSDVVPKCIVPLTWAPRFCFDVSAPAGLALPLESCYALLAISRVPFIYTPAQGGSFMILSEKTRWEGRQWTSTWNLSVHWF